MKKKLNFRILFLSLLPFIFLQLNSQESKINPYVTFQYFKDTDGKRILQTTLTYSKNRMELPLPGMEITFYTGEGTKVLLTKNITDTKGIARFELTADLKPEKGSDGMWAFSTEFNGNDTIEGGTSEITVKDMRLEMTSCGGRQY